MRIHYGERQAPAVSTEEVADFLGLAVGVVPPTLSHLIELATDLVERYTLRATSVRNYTIWMQHPPLKVVLPFPPLIGDPEVFGYCGKELVDVGEVDVIRTEPAQLILPRSCDLLKVGYTAGHEEVPVDLKDAILRVIAQRWELRSAHVIPECIRLEDPLLWRQLASC